MVRSGVVNQRRISFEPKQLVHVIQPLLSISAVRLVDNKLTNKDDVSVGENRRHV